MHVCRVLIVWPQQFILSRERINKQYILDDLVFSEGKWSRSLWNVLCKLIYEQAII